MIASEIRTLFATSLRKWRSRRGFSQEELAERADLHRTYISDVERGARNLSLESIDKLARALEISVSTMFTSQDPTAAGDAAPPTPGHELVEVILIEDNTDDVDMALSAFKKARFANTVRVVRDGGEAAELFFGKGALANHAREGRQQLILLDLNLPKVSGVELLRRFKADLRTRPIPVVVLTISDRDADLAECRRLGAQAFISKPLNLQGLTTVTPELSLVWALIKPNVGVAASV